MAKDLPSIGSPTLEPELKCLISLIGIWGIGWFQLVVGILNQDV